MGGREQAAGVIRTVDAGARAFAKDSVGEDGAFRVLGNDDCFFLGSFDDTVSNGTRGVVGDVDAGAFAPVDFAVDKSGVGFAREARAVVFTGNVAVSKGSFGFVRDDETIAAGARERATFD